MAFGLGLEIGEIDVALIVAVDNDNLEAGHLRRGRVGAVRRAGNQTDVAVPLTAAGVIATDGDDAGVLPLRARIRLQADGVETGDDLQPLFQAGDHLQITLRLIERGERVNPGEFRPGDRHHFAGGVEFHGARTQGDHRMIEC